MEESLPYTPGRMYQPIEGEMQWFYDLPKDPNQIGTRYPETYSSSFIVVQSPSIKMQEGSFLPVAYVASKEIVVGYTMCSIGQRTQSVEPMNNGGYGINFQTITVREEELRPIRIEMDVNEFIKKMEIVL